MNWAQILTMIVTNIGFVTILFLWNRSESRADYRHMEARTDAILKAIQSEMKDFHKRLCVIEERRK
jgi:hypothetical protein